MTRPTITPDLLMSEAGRQLMAGELTTVQAYWPELRLSAETTAVHETRKAIRRTFTLFKLFAPFFANGELEPHRRGLRKIMRRLAPCRDTAVFRMKLADYHETAERPLEGLTDYWNARQVMVDGDMRDFLARRSAAETLNRYARLTSAAGAGLPKPDALSAPIQVRHALPAVLFQRIGAVRAYGDLLPNATLDQLHQLRIQFKELRYTLSFFKDILVEQAGQFVDVSRRMQEFLGDLNDVSVAIELLDRMNEHREEAAVYRDYQQSRLDQLVGEVPARYAEFDRPDIRLELATLVATL